MTVAVEDLELVDLRVRSWIPPDELEAKKGRIVTPRDYNVVLTGPARVHGPRGQLLCVYLPGVLTDLMDDAWDVLAGIKLVTDNRGLAAGSGRQTKPGQRRSRSRRIQSGLLGAVDRVGRRNTPGPGGRNGIQPVCRLTAWTGTHLPEWQSLTPLFAAISDHLAVYAPEQAKRQAAAVARTHPDWRIPGTLFTTVTINNTYATGVHQDAGDLPEGMSTLAVARRGAYSGGHLVLPEYRVAVDLHHGDLLLLDAHQWHGNTNMRCPHYPVSEPVPAGLTLGALDRPCGKGCERISLVSYMRTNVQVCGSAEEEAAKIAAMDRPGATT